MSLYVYKPFQQLSPHDSFLFLAHVSGNAIHFQCCAAIASQPLQRTVVFLFKGRKKESKRKIIKCSFASKTQVFSQYSLLFSYFHTVFLFPHCFLMELRCFAHFQALKARIGVSLLFPPLRIRSTKTSYEDFEISL